MFAAKSVRRFVLTLGCLSLVLAPLVASADIPGPGPRPRPPRPRPTEPVLRDQAAPLEVVLEDGEGPLRLEIPKGLLPKEVGGKAGGALGGLGDLRTILSGLALSLAVVVGGLWAVRRFGLTGSKPIPRIASAGAIVTIVVAGLAVATAWADLLPPGVGQRRPPRPVPAEGLSIQIVIVEKGEKVVLHASPGDVAKMVAGIRPGRGVGSAPPAPRTPKE